jgi:hypothetical protein
VSKRKITLENVSKLASIGVQAIEAHRARRAWVEAKSKNRKVFLEFVDGSNEAYIKGDDEEVDASYEARRLAAKKSRSEAAKLRYQIAKYDAWVISRMNG